MSGAESEENRDFETHREIRRERKRIARADRSKFKKTDWDKRPSSRSQLRTGEIEGQIVRSQGDLYLVATPEYQNPIPCTLRGALKKEFTRNRNLAVVGDRVLISPRGSDEGSINAVLDRSSALYRADNLSRRKRHLIAANIDWGLIIASVKAPTLKPAFIDRCIIAAQRGGVRPLIAINKIDLLETGEGAEEMHHLLELRAVYRRAEIPLHLISAHRGAGLDELLSQIGHQGAAVAGQSGVGKTSLLNALTGRTLAVGPVRRSGKGTHTTTHAQLIPLKTGGWIIDTPGVRSFGVWDLEAGEIEGHFGEILRAGASCRFSSCTHLGEEGCAIPAAIDSGSISLLRYQSYAALCAEVNARHLRR